VSAPPADKSIDKGAEKGPEKVNDKAAGKAADPARVSVRILDRDYQVACPPAERDALVESAAFLGARMKEIRDTGKVVGADRIAVMAALNIAHELLKLRDAGHSVQHDAGARIRQLRERVETALQNGQQIDL
jgi:cell division protein ZapA